MAIISDEAPIGLPKSMIGILHPHFMGKWMINIDVMDKTTITKDAFRFLCLQIINCKIDLQNDLVQIELEQPKYYFTYFIFLLKELINAKNINLNFFDPDDKLLTHPFLCLKNTKVLKHEYELSYKLAAEGKQISTHLLTFDLNFSDLRERTLIAIHDAEKITNPILEVHE